MRLRKLSVLAAVLAVVASVLAGCRTNVGTAATVGRLRISESDVNRYVTVKGADPSLVASARKQGQDVAPKSEVLQYLIQEQLFRKVLASHGGVPSSSTLAATQNAAAALLFQTQLTGSALTKALVSGLTRSGVRASFAKRYLTVETLEYVLIKRARLSQFAQLAALVNKRGARVSVSPRYGKWDKASLQLNRAAAIPAFVKLQPTPGASSSAASPSTGGGS